MFYLTLTNLFWPVVFFLCLRIASTGQTETGQRSSWPTGWPVKTSTLLLKTLTTPTTSWSSTSFDSHKVCVECEWGALHVLPTPVSSLGFDCVSWVSPPPCVRVGLGACINNSEPYCSAVSKAPRAAAHSHVCQKSASNTVFSNGAIQIQTEPSSALNHGCDVCVFSFLSATLHICLCHSLVLPSE